MAILFKQTQPPGMGVTIAKNNMRMILCIGYIVLISFALFERAQAFHGVVFVSPTSGQNFAQGSIVNVQVGVFSSSSIVSVDQYCGSEPVMSQTLDSSNSYTATFQLPASYIGQCNYFALDPFTESSASVGINVITPEQLVIANPSAGSELTIGVPFNVLVTTQDPIIESPITLAFTSTSSQDISGTTNVEQSVTLDSSYLGSNSLAVTATTPYANPDTISIVLKYGLEFTVAPTFIVKGVPFNIFLQTSDTIVSPAPSTIQVSLTCGNSIIKSWTGIPLNQLTTLSAVSNDSSSDQSNCILSTEAANQFYYQATTAVSVVSSPFGGQLKPITPEQQAAFAMSIAFPPSEI